MGRTWDKFMRCHFSLYLFVATMFLIFFAALFLTAAAHRRTHAASVFIFDRMIVGSFSSVVAFSSRYGHGREAWQNQSKVLVNNVSDGERETTPKNGTQTPPKVFLKFREFVLRYL